MLGADEWACIASHARALPLATFRLLSRHIDLRLPACHRVQRAWRRFLACDAPLTSIEEGAHVVVVNRVARPVAHCCLGRITRGVWWLHEACCITLVQVQSLTHYPFLHVVYLYGRRDLRYRIVRADASSRSAMGSS